MLNELHFKLGFENYSEVYMEFKDSHFKLGFENYSEVYMEFKYSNIYEILYKE